MVTNSLHIIIEQFIYYYRKSIIDFCFYFNKV